MSEKIVKYDSIEKNSKLGLIKFILATGVAFFFLFVSVTQDGFNPLISVVADNIFNFMEPYISVLIFGFLSILGIGSLITYVFRPKFILNNPVLNLFFYKKGFDTIIRILAIIIVAMVVFQFGPKVVVGEIGGSMIGAAGLISVWMLLFTFIFPIFTQYGLDEFLGTIMEPIMKPLFKVPGVSAMCSVLALIMGPTMGAVVANQQFEDGHYTDREAAIVMTALVGPHIPAILLYTSILNIGELFPKFLLCSTITIVLTGIIVSRIPPISKISNKYLIKREASVITIPQDRNRISYALDRAALKAKDARISVLNSFMLIIEVLSILVPFIITLGTISFVVVYNTPIFEWISYPMGYYLQLLGVEGAFEIAPATIIGIVEGMLPIILATGFETIQQKFLVGVLATVQIIFFTELAIVIFSSKVSLNLKDLAIIFLERTIIALPIIVVLMKFIF